MIYIVKQGDCISSIAAKFGLFPDTISRHSNNTSFGDKNKELEILKPGDEIFVPEKGIREEGCGTEEKHSFRRLGVPAYFRIQLLDMELEPRASERVTFEIDGKSKWVTTDEDGWIEEPISPTAKEVILSIFEDEEELFYEFWLGELDPITEISGIQQRLCNLGFYHGRITGEINEETTYGIEGFQRFFDLEPDGKLTDTTIAQIEETHKD